MLAIVDAKRDEFLEMFDAMNGPDLMHSEATKRTRISKDVMEAGFSSHFPDYYRVADYYARIGINSKDYWMLTSDKHVAEKLHRSFSKEIYVQIHKWFG